MKVKPIKYLWMVHPPTIPRKCYPIVLFCGYRANIVAAVKARWAKAAK
jgi:hypothetical protein